MLQRNLIYTGVTRGKKLVVLVGQKRAVAIAVKNISGRRRWSKLDEWLAAAKPGLSESGGDVLFGAASAHPLSGNAGAGGQPDAEPIYPKRGACRRAELAQPNGSAITGKR